MNGVTISSINGLTMTDATGNRIYQQRNDGTILGPQTSSGDALIPFARYGFANSAAWVSISSTINGWSKIGQVPSFAGEGFKNVGSIYNPSNGRFTAPLTGFYLIRHHMYVYINSTSTTGNRVYYMYAVNGAYGQNRLGGAGWPAKSSLQGMFGTMQHDTDSCEIMYLYAGDYVEIAVYLTADIQVYPPNSTYAVTFLGT